VGRYILERHLETPPERVFEAFTDPALMSDWMDLAEIREMTGPLGTPGTRYMMVVRGPWRFRSEVLRSQRPTLHEYAGHGPLGSSYRMTATLTPRGGATDLELETEYALAFGPIGRLLDRLFVDREPRTIANRELDRLVELVSRDG
jgi:uncharacterized protein YndB with AHSA1/START domain